MSASNSAVSRIRGVVDARREVEAGEWNDAAVGRIRTVLRRLEGAHQVLDGDTLPRGAVEAVREGLKALDEERRPADPLVATTREVLGRLESADLPLPVLTRALDDIRMSQIAGREAAAVLLERLQMVLELPWTARASERVDIEAAMAELDAAHAGRAGVKERVRRFLATRQLTSTTWTVEGLSPGGRSRGGDGSAPAARRRLAGPSGGGKTTLAKLIAPRTGPCILLSERVASAHFSGSSTIRTGGRPDAPARMATGTNATRTADNGVRYWSVYRQQWLVATCQIDIKSRGLARWDGLRPALRSRPLTGVESGGLPAACERKG